MERVIYWFDGKLRDLSDQNLDCNIFERKQIEKYIYLGLKEYKDVVNSLTEKKIR